MKQLIIILLVCTCTNRIFCQSITNNNYDNKGIQEFASHILNYKDDFLVLSGSKAKKFEGSYGILIRRISKKGEVIWTDFYKDESDSIYYYFAGQDNSILVNDSLLFAFGSAQDVNLDLSLTFFKYNLYTRQVVGLKIYNSTYGGRFYTAHLHNDGYFYAGGIVYKNKVLTEYDMLLMKIDINGEVIWEKEYAYGEQEDIFDIESYNDLLICTGRTVDPVISTQVFISKIDTNGEIKQFETFFEFGDVGATGIEVQDDAIYMTSNSEIELVDEETTYLSKLDGDFNVVWDTLIASSSKYDLQSRSMSLINNQIIILGNINPSYHHTNWKKWTYATSWSLDGKLNWEQLFYYDVDFIHYLDDVAGLPNGDLVFMGTTSGFLQEGVFSKNLWLFRTDNMGCGTVQVIHLVMSCKLKQIFRQKLTGSYLFTIL